MWFFRIGPSHNQFYSCVTMGSPMELILYLCEKQPRCLIRLVIIQRSGIDVGDLLVEPALRHPNLLALYQQVAEVSFCEYAAASMAQPWIVESLMMALAHFRNWTTRSLLTLCDFDGNNVSSACSPSLER